MNTKQQPPLPTLQPGDSHMESLIQAAIQGHASTRDAMRWLVRQLVPQPAQATQAEVTDHVIRKTYSDVMTALREENRHVIGGAVAIEIDMPVRFARAILALRPVQSGLTGCNCRWDGDTQVQWCELHLAHKEAIHEWAERAKEAEKQLAMRPAAVPMTDKPIADAVAAEREACAQICDSMPYRVASARKASRAIRERGITAQAKKEGA